MQQMKLSDKKRDYPPSPHPPFPADEWGSEDMEGVAGDSSCQNQLAIWLARLVAMLRKQAAKIAYCPRPPA